ncbi:RecX family transcriptional regulator [Thermotalea metallivorans]|uniref:Regulatory protein RecX n=1 Tax=Thermotalea metallivorans TaxID=520762 RepID=A0A140L3A5_9FIRM|nr:RecX family transcriptional regulator [Thermotalea metallivorans]KXG75030.1 Regulatory protein RecX [Thermotalea metallivorans]
MSKEYKGKITKIEQQIKNKKRYSVYIDDQFAFGISEDLLVRYRLLKGKEIDLTSIGRIIAHEEQNKADNYAIKLLSYRPRTAKELQQKMKEKGYEDSVIENTLSVLKEHNYINDEDFAKSFIKDKMQFRKIGKIRMKQELSQKGVEKNIIHKVMAEHMDSEKELETALALGRKKLETTYKNDDRKAQYRKLGSFLQSKGFAYDMIIKVLNMLLKEQNF